MTYCETLSKTDYKVKARADGIALFRSMTGLHSIPATKQYWTLCNRQSGPESEIEQCVSSGLLVKSQFHGVDNNEYLIVANQVDHPDAHWYAGKWTDVISDFNPAFNPALVYLDMVYTANNTLTADTIVATMRQCPVGAVILVNVAMVNPNSGESSDLAVLDAHIQDRCTDTELAAWGWDEGFEGFEYSSGRTIMYTFVIRRKS